MATSRIGKRGHVRWHDDTTGAQLPTDAESYRPVVAPNWNRLRGIDWVCGSSLDRVVVKNSARVVVSVGDHVEVWVKLATKNMLMHGCDRCAGPHDPTNNKCSQTLGVPTSMATEGIMYNIRTGKKLKCQYELIEYNSSPRHVHEAIFKCTSTH